MVSEVAVEPIQDPVLSGGTPPTGELMTVYSPYSGTAVGEVTAASNDDIATVLDRAQGAAAPDAEVERQRSGRPVGEGRFGL